MTLIPDPPAPDTKPDHLLVETALAGHLGGPSYAYRGAVIDCMKGAHVCRLTMDGHPLTRVTFGVAGTITPLIKLWLEEGRLLGYMRGPARRPGGRVRGAAGAAVRPCI
jgi:hypothetical protein